VTAYIMEPLNERDYRIPFWKKQELYFSS